jgi:phosphoribosylanthranilate isomerase
MTRVKICGLTNLEDAICATEAGADMLGFIFYPKSPRAAHVDVVMDITPAVRAINPQVKCVGVFVNESPAHMLRILDLAGLDYAQLSGDEPPEVLRAMGSRAYKVVREGHQLAAFAFAIPNPQPDAPDFLLDTPHTQLYGGTGVRADEFVASALARQRRMILAGGLNPNNVAEAIRAVQPWGVDVASGVEAAPGRKDHEKVRAFVEAARG